MSADRKLSIVTCDAGGTMTDVFAIDDEGNFCIGKAATTPHDESIGYRESLADALSYWGMDMEGDGKGVLDPLQVAIYSGTTMLNALLQRKGRPVGLIVTKGFEDSLVLERGFQRSAGFSYGDRLHAVTHYRNPPLVPRRLTRGVTERIDTMGRVAIPLYEDEVREAVRELVALGVEAIAVMFLCSYLAPNHEQVAGRIAKEVIAELGKEVEVFLSSDICPMTREVSRLNGVVVHATSSEVVRKSLHRIEDKLRADGFRRDLQVLLSYGGLADIRYPRLFESMVSGPVGGLLGGQHAARLLGIENMITTDGGGTSFDIGLITAGRIPIKREPDFARLTFNMPMLVVNSVGAGTGTYLRLDPINKRVLLGPDSAGAVPGPVCYDMGNETPTIADCDLILGILNPDYYLGGHVKLNKEKALSAFEEKIADPLGMDVYDAAEGMIGLVNTRMCDAIREMVLSRGFTPADYTLIAFGGSGPMHMAGYGEGLDLAGVVTCESAPAFSALGCAMVDVVHRYHQSTSFFIPPNASAEQKANIADGINKVWAQLEEKALEVAAKEGYRPEDVAISLISFVRYGQQLDDVEVVSPWGRLDGAANLEQLLGEFEDLYGRLYGLGAKYPQGGYAILELAAMSTVPKVKPNIAVFELQGREPAREAHKGRRPVYYHGRWHDTPLYEMSQLAAGNEVEGIAVIEAPATTLFVPPGKRIRLDQWRFMWLE